MITRFRCVWDRKRYGLIDLHFCDLTFCRFACIYTLFQYTTTLATLPSRCLINVSKPVSINTDDRSKKISPRCRSQGKVHPSQFHCDSPKRSELMNRGFNLAPAQSKDYNDTPRNALRMFDSIKLTSQFRASGRTSSEDTGERTKKRKLDDTKEKKDEVKDQKGESSRPQTIKPSHTSQKGESKPKKEGMPKIRDNESISDYNRRVESLLRPGVAKAIKSANSLKSSREKEAKQEKQKRREAQGVPEPIPQAEVAVKKRPGVHDVNDPAKEFRTVSSRRLNDIVQAPPMLDHLRKGMGPGGKKKGTGGETSAWKATGRLPVNVGQERLLNQERERVVKAYREIKAEREKERAKVREGKAETTKADE